MPIYIYFGETHVATVHLIWADPTDWILDHVEITYPDDPDNVSAPAKTMISNAIFKNSEEVVITGGHFETDDLQFFYEGVQAAIIALQNRIPSMRVLWPEDLPVRNTESLTTGRGVEF